MSAPPPGADLDDLIARFAAEERAGELPPPIANYQTLEALAALGDSSGEDELGDTVASFRETSISRTEELRRGLAEGHAETVAAAAHFIAGGAGALGARYLEELCRKLAQRARRGCLEGGTGLLQRIEAEFQRVVAELERYHASQQRPTWG